MHGQLLLLVVDVADPTARQQLRIVEETLDSIGAVHQPRVLVLNQVDRLARRDDLLPWLRDNPDAITLSARTGEGVEELAERVLETVLGPLMEVTVEVPLSSGKAVDFLERRTEILERQYEDDRVAYRTRIGRRQAEQLLARGGDATINGVPLREAIKTHWPRKAWNGPPLNGRDGVIEDVGLDAPGGSDH